MHSTYALKSRQRIRASCIGYESVVFASDFPHEITMDNCMEEIGEILERDDLKEEYKLAILGENARKFYKV